MAWVDRHAAYLSACRRIAKELRTEPERSRFKRDKDYAAVVGNDTRGIDVTRAFLLHLRRPRETRALHARCAPNDRIGGPVLHRIGTLSWSAGSLRYAQVADEIGDAPAVVEIGGGYGGQRLLCRGIEDYTIVDLPEALDVQRAYLAYHRVATTFVEAGARVDVRPGTFLLSDYALSELEPEQIDGYMEQVVSKCASGRITCRTSARDGLVKRLTRYFPVITSEPEQPATSKHDNVVIRFVVAQ